MRRIAVLGWALAILALPATASAAITASSDGPTLAGALEGGAAATLAEHDAVGTPDGTANSALGGFPRQGGTFTILTNGNVASADDAGGSADTALSNGPGHGFAGAEGNAYDQSVLSIALDVPAGMNCLSFDYRFLSEEWPDNVGSLVNDGFVALLDDTTWSADLTGDIAAPGNFAFDTNGHLISVNTTSFTDTEVVGAEGSDTPYHGTTPVLTASRSVTPGAHTLTLALFDQGDRVLDSAVFLDNLRFTNVVDGPCDPTVDRTPPAVGLTVDTSSGLPAFNGSAGFGAADSKQVTVQVYPEGATVPIEILSTDVSPADGSWQTASSSLPAGNYFAQAHQTDVSGNVGTSTANGFTVAGDATPPVPIIESPGPGAVSLVASPTISGVSGIDAGDLPDVTVEVFQGGSTGGALVDATVATADDGDWSTDVGPLANGTYTVRARQSDQSGNEGLSDPVTFRVAVRQEPTPTPTPTPTATPTPTPPPPPEPKLGETVVAGPVSGTIKVKGKNGKFRTLGASEAIPLGSTVDATKGRVRLTAASGPAGQIQTADFYLGAFVITQTGGTKPVTQLALAGALRCTVKSGKASASARKKKVRRLWGDGHGRFRTKGRRAAATVRGTKWLTEDRCDSTKITVKRGTVVVRDFAKKQNVVVKKGHSYVARANRKKRK
jgi:hypothetical protein